MNQRRIWNLWCRFSGIAMISLMISGAIVYATSGDDAVVNPSTDVQFKSLTVPPGGPLKYTHVTHRVETCPGDVIWTFTPLTIDPKIEKSVWIKRRAIRPEFTVRDNFADYWVSVPLDSAVTMGEWEFELSVDSQCPTRRRVDVLFRQKFNVVAGATE